MPIAPEDEPFAAQGVPFGPHGRRIGVLLCHGFTGGPSSLRAWAEYLCGHGFAVSVPRLPGHGTRWEELNQTTYQDWYAEVDQSFEKLQTECDQVFVTGLSMGGCLALHLAVEKGRELAGLVLVNPSVSTARKNLLLLRLVKHLVPASRGIGSDVKKPGVVERAYPKTPLKAAHSYLSTLKEVRDRLPEVTQPLLLFRSRVDHVVDRSSARIILSSVSSRDLEERVLEDSYHVATLDNDAPAIFAGSAEFIRRVAEENQPATTAPGP